MLIYPQSPPTTLTHSTIPLLRTANGPLSFANQVGKGSTPAWCGMLTDEVHVMTITGCSSSGV